MIVSNRNIAANSSSSSAKEAQIEVGTISGSTLHSIPEMFSRLEQHLSELKTQIDDNHSCADRLFESIVPVLRNCDIERQAQDAPPSESLPGESQFVHHMNGICERLRYYAYELNSLQVRLIRAASAVEL